MNDWLDWIFTPVHRPLDWLIDHAPEPVANIFAMIWVGVVLMAHGVGSMLLAEGMRWSWNVITHLS